MIALLCALVLSAQVLTLPSDPGKPGQVLTPDPRTEGGFRWAYPITWQFTMRFYGRAIVVDGWTSEQECREMKATMKRNYPDAIVSDCEVSR